MEEGKQEEVSEIKQEVLYIKEENVTFAGDTSVPTNCISPKIESHSSEKLSRDNTATKRDSKRRPKSQCKSSVQMEYYCAHCSYSTTSKQGLLTHVTHHSKTRPFACDECDYKAMRRDNLRRHLLLAHTSDKRYYCRVCDFKTAYKDSLNQHLIIHAAEKPYSCNQCDFQTAYRNNLKRHVLGHTAKNSYCCSNCDFKTAYEDSFKLHHHHCKGVTVHNPKVYGGKKLHSCEQCDFKTKNTYDFKQHLLVHVDCKDTKDSVSILLDPKTVPDECIAFNSTDLAIKEEPGDSIL